VGLWHTDNLNNNLNGSLNNSLNCYFLYSNKVNKHPGLLSFFLKKFDPQAAHSETDCGLRRLQQVLLWATS
jgi:hypothetical protein